MRKKCLILVILFSMNNCLEAADLKVSPFMLQMLGGALKPCPIFAHPMCRSIISDMQFQLMHQAMQSERQSEAARISKDAALRIAKKVAALCFCLAKWLAVNWPAVLGSTVFIGAGVAYNAYNLTRLRAEMALHRRETERGFVDAQADRNEIAENAHTHRERIASASSSALKQGLENAQADRERRDAAAQNNRNELHGDLLTKINESNRTLKQGLENTQVNCERIAHEASNDRARLSTQITESADGLSQALVQARLERERIIEQQACLARAQQVEEMQEQLAALEEMFSHQLSETKQAMLERFDTLQQTIEVFESVGLAREVASLREKLDQLQREFIAPLTIQIGGASRRLTAVEKELKGVRSDTAALLAIARGSAGRSEPQAAEGQDYSLAASSSSPFSLMTHFGNNAPFTSAMRSSSRLLTDRVVQAE